MSTIILENVTDNKKIHAIKAYRAIAGLPLKESKEAIDGLPDKPIMIHDADLGIEVTRATAILDEGYVIYRIETPRTSLTGHIDFLSRYPGDMTVEALLNVLQPMLRMLKQDQIEP